MGDNDSLIMYIVFPVLVVGSLVIVFANDWLKKRSKKASSHQESKAGKSSFTKPVSRWEVVGFITFCGLIFLSSVLGLFSEFMETIKVVGILAIGAGCLALLYLAWKIVQVSRLPCNKIAKLSKQGKLEEARSLGMSVLENNPDDWLTRINTTGVLIAMGRAEEARSLFAPLKRESLPEVARKTWDTIHDKLDKIGLA